MLTWVTGPWQKNPKVYTTVWLPPRLRLNCHTFWFPQLISMEPRKCPLIGTFPIYESPKTPVEPSSTRCWAVNPNFDRAILLIELRHSEVLGRYSEEGAEGLFARQNPKQALLKLPMIMHGCQFRLAHGSVLLKSGHEVNLVSALSTGEFT